MRCKIMTFQIDHSLSIQLVDGISKGRVLPTKAREDNSLDDAKTVVLNLVGLKPVYSI